MSRVAQEEPARVLYMEDDAGLARLLQKKLEGEGYVVDVAGDGRQGLAMMEDGCYDLLLVDLKMPVYDGLEVIRILGFRDCLPPTIMVTGGGDERTAARAITLGAADYVVKDAAGGYLELLPMVIEQVLSRERLAEEKRRAEEELLKSEEAYRALAENLPVGIFRTTADPEGRIVSGNPALAVMFGYGRPEDLVDVDVVDLYADRGERARFAERVRREGAAEGFEALFKRRDGGEFWASLSARAVYDDDGAVAYFDGVIEDVTERRRAEEALREREERYRLLFNSGDDVVFVHGLEDDGSLGPFVEVNDIACRRLGYTRKELLDMPTAYVTAPADVEDRKALIEKLRADKHVIFESALVPKGGEKIPVEINAHLFDYRGRPTVLSVARDITERRKAEAALRESEEKFRRISAAANDAIIMMGSGGLISYWNEAAASIFGYDAEEVLGERLHEVLVPKQYRSQCKKGLAAFYETGKGPIVGRTLEVTALRKNGAVFPVELSFSALKIKGEWNALAILRDISERKRGEEALRRAHNELEARVQERTAELTTVVEKLRESEEKYRGVVEQIQDGLVIIRDGALEFFNRKFAETVGYQAEELKGRPFEDLLAPDEREKVVARYLKRMAGEEEVPSVYESVGIARDGREIPVEFNVTVIQFEGQPAELVIIRDLTERREQERVVREQRWILKNVLNNMSELVYVVDPDTCELLFANETAEHMLGGELLGQPCYRAVWGLEAPCHGCKIEKIFTNGDDGTYTREAFNEKLGRWFRINMRAVPWRDGGQVCCAVAADISESKALEEEIIAHNRALHQTVKDRTAALENKNRELESFAYSVSHDLRAPLRSIEGFSRALLDDYHDRLAEDGRDFLKRIVNGAVRMDRLINDLLNYSRLGRRGVDYERVDLNELVAVAVEELEENVRAEGGRVEVAGPFPEIQGDRSMLLVLLHNLIGNAIKYHKKGTPPEVRVSCRENGDKIVCGVADNGIGLDPKYQLKIFDIFQRLHSEAEYPGTGIGLASAKKVVTAHGGRIWYESEPGAGTTFFFELPRRRKDDDNGGG